MKSSKKVKTIIQNMVRKLKNNYTPKKIILFGSYAYGNPKSNSDIDLLIIKDTSEWFIDRWITVRRILTDPKRIIPLETLVLTPKELSERLAKGDQFLAEILEKGEVLYAA